MKRLVYSSSYYDLENIEKVSHDIFNDLMNTYREDLSNHTDKAVELIEDAVRTQYADYDFDLQDIGDIIDAVFDTVDSYNSTWDDYYGKFAYDKYGDRIANIFQNQIISKRIDDLDKDYSDEVIGLRAAARHIGTTPSMILQALEGMCYNNKAYEFDDSHYFVGSYEDWKKFGAV
jgi:hypothetical protein